MPCSAPRVPAMLIENSQLSIKSRSSSFSNEFHYTIRLNGQAIRWIRRNRNQYPTQVFSPRTCMQYAQQIAEFSNQFTNIVNIHTSVSCRFPGSQDIWESEIPSSTATTLLNSSISSCSTTSSIKEPLVALLLPLSPAYPLLLGLEGPSISSSETVLPHTKPCSEDSLPSPVWSSSAIRVFWLTTPWVSRSASERVKFNVTEANWFWMDWGLGSRSWSSSEVEELVSDGICYKINTQN